MSAPRAAARHDAHHGTKSGNIIRKRPCKFKRGFHMSFAKVNTWNICVCTLDCDGSMRYNVCVLIDRRSVKWHRQHLV